MDQLFRDLPFVKIYLDDLLIASPSLDEHLEHLRAVFKVLERSKLSLNAGKCTIASTEVIYLGYHVNADGFKPPEDRIKTIINYPQPVTIEELRRFNGIFNFYRAAIPGAARLEAPLTDLLQGSQKKKDKRLIEWTPELEAAFNACRLGITEAVRMTFLAPDAPLTLLTDASSTSLGAALNQLQSDIWRPLGLFSQKLTPAEKNYSPYDRELLAIFTALKHFEHLLEGREFVIKTDRKLLVKALEQRPEKASPRQLRQLDYISQFCLTLEHVSGEDNVVADALSRVEAIDMPSQLTPAAISEAQQPSVKPSSHQ